MAYDMNPERVNELDENGRPPIVVAAYGDDLDLIRALLRAGANIDAKSDRGKSALFTAVVYGQTDTVKLLISSGADLSEKDDILLAAVSSRPPLESIQLMLEVGADPNYVQPSAYPIPSGLHSTPLQQAAAFGALEVVKFLVENGASIADPPHPLVGAVVRGRIETALYLIKQGADPNVLDPDGNPLLFAALRTPEMMIHYPEVADVDPIDHQLRLIDMLIENGSNPKLRNRDGDTMLQVAVRDNHGDLIRLLQ